MPENFDSLREALALVQEDLKNTFPDTDPALLLAITLLKGDVRAVIREQAAGVVYALAKKKREGVKNGRTEGNHC